MTNYFNRNSTDIMIEPSISAFECNFTGINSCSGKTDVRGMPSYQLQFLRNTYDILALETVLTVRNSDFKACTIDNIWTTTNVLS